MGFSKRHLREAGQIIDAFDIAPIEHMVSILVELRDTGGRLFFLVSAAAPGIADTR